MENEQQSEALRLLDWFEESGGFKQGTQANHKWVLQAEQELRRLHAESEQHMQELAAYRFTVENLRERVAELEAERTARMTQNDRMAERIAELESLVQRAAEIERAAILLRVKNRAVAGALLVDDFRSIVADRGPAAPVPQGWKLVPVQPTAQMKRAAQIADMDHSPHSEWLKDEWQDKQRVWSAMLAAASQPPEAAPVQLPEHTTSEHSKPMFGAAPKVDPIAWYVTGCSTMLDEHDAKAEAKRCGGTAQAVPLYTEQQVRDLLAANGIGGAA